MEAELAVVRRAEAQVEDAREHEHPHHVKQQEDPYVAHDALEHQDERREPLIEVLEEAEERQPEKDRRGCREVGAQVYARSCRAHERGPGAREHGHVEPIPVVPAPRAR